MSEQVLTVAGWNVRDGLSEQAAMPLVVERIVALEADIVVLPEAYSEAARTGDAQKAETLHQAATALGGEGYTMHRVLYADADGRKDRHGFALLTRLTEAKNPVSVFTLENRKVLGQTFGDLALTVVGVHLDDRSEATRLVQASDLLQQLDPAQYNIILGDFNGMHRADPRARALRAARPLALALPSVDPGETAPYLPKLHRAGSLASRLTDMANGSLMDQFAQSGYEDVSRDYQPTKGPVQLDHIVSNLRALHPADQWLRIVQVHETTKAESDHRPISATVSY